MLFQVVVQNAQTTNSSFLITRVKVLIFREIIAVFWGLLYEVRKERLVWRQHPSVRPSPSLSH